MSLPLPQEVTGAGVGPVCVVTGAAGYLGGYLVRALKTLGCEVRAVDLRPAFADDPEVRTVVADVRDADALATAMDGADTVFHAAALLTILKVARPAVRQRVWDVNVGGAEAVIAACRRAGVGRLVHTSSVNVCVDGPRHEQDETAPYARRAPDLYTETKIAAEQAVLAANGGGLQTVAVRPGGIWGPGEGGFMLRAFLQQLARGAFVATFGPPDAVVDNTHVYNLVHAELLAAQRLAIGLPGGEAFFVTDDERFNGLEWFRPVVEALGHPWPKWRLPGRLMSLVGLAGEWVHYFGGPEPTLTSGGVLKLIASTSFRVDKARRELGWAPVRGRDDGLAEAMDDLRAVYAQLREGA